MDILVFDIKGMFAHFRKYYTNSSSLTYTIPPRTTVAGLIGAVLGYERDSYYDLFNSDRLSIALRKMTPTRKIIQSLNYIKAESIGTLFAPKSHTQIPFEVVCSEGEVAYRVYVHHEDKGIIDELENRIKKEQYAYAPYLGAAPFNCHFEFIARTEGIREQEDSVKICTVVDSRIIKRIMFDTDQPDLLLMREKMPCDFNHERVLTEIKSYIFDDKGTALPLQLNQDAVAITYQEVTDHIVFM